MVSAKTNCCPWTWRGSYSSSLVKLWSYMMPLLLFAGLISLLGPKLSFWVATNPLLYASSTNSSASSQKLSQGDVDYLSSNQVAFVDAFANKEENDISNPSFSPRPALQPSVRNTSLFLIVAFLISWRLWNNQSHWWFISSFSLISFQRIRPFDASLMLEVVFILIFYWIKGKNYVFFLCIFLKFSQKCLSDHMLYFLD